MDRHRGLETPDDSHDDGSPLPEVSLPPWRAAGHWSPLPEALNYPQYIALSGSQQQVQLIPYLIYPLPYSSDTLCKLIRAHC